MPLSDREFLQINLALVSLVNAYLNRVGQEGQGAAASLSVAERTAILVLGQMAPINLSRLSKALQVSSGPASVYVHKLIKKDLVKREQDQTDKRNWWLRLTPSGESVYAETLKGAVDYTRQSLNSLNESEQRRLRELLLKASHDLGHDW